MARSVYHQGRRGSRNNRWFCSLQHPVHHWSVWDLRWAGKCVTVYICRYILCVGLFIWQKLELVINLILQSSCYSDTSATMQCVQQLTSKAQDI